MFNGYVGPWRCTCPEKKYIRPNCWPTKSRIGKLDIHVVQTVSSTYWIARSKCDMLFIGEKKMNYLYTSPLVYKEIEGDYFDQLASFKENNMANVCAFVQIRR